MTGKDYSVEYTLRTYAEQYKQTKATQVKERKEILRAMFDSLNKSKAASGQPEVIDYNDVKDLDNEFKKIMGLTTSSSRKYSEEDFNKNIGLLVDKFAKWEEPKAAPPPPAPAKPIPKLAPSHALILADALSTAITPPYGNNWWGDIFTDDDEVAGNVKALFVNQGDGSPYINSDNIVEVLDQLDLKAFRKSCNLLDDKDETAVLKLVTALVRERINKLKDAGVTVPSEVETTLGKIKTSSGSYWRNVGNEDEFDTNMTSVVSGLRGLGVQK